MVGIRRSKEEIGELGIDSTIQVEIYEATIDNSTGFILSCRTEKDYTCSNFSIITDLDIHEDPFNITFLGVDKPNLCATAIGPATKLIDLGTLAEGVYEITLNNGSLKNKGILEITGQEIMLKFSQQKGIEILTPRVLR